MAIAIESPRAWDAHLSWRAEAECRDLNPNLFFPVGVPGPAVDQIATAMEICSMCSVRSECLEFAITSNQEFGVWGGTSAEERRVLRRQWRARVRAQKLAAVSAS